MTDATQPEPIRILEISASGRYDDSASRRLSTELADAIARRYGSAEIRRRDLVDGVPFVDATWIDATFTPVERRDSAQRAALADSDALVREVMDADILVIGTPMYNFGPPAVLKAWIDMVARAGLTFRYTESGPVGLIEGKKAYVVVATGGVAVGSEADFLTPWLEQALAFLGIDDVEVIPADRLNVDADEALASARSRIAGITAENGDGDRRVA